VPDLLDRIREEIRERLEASREAVEESRRLEGALAALESTDGHAAREGQTTSARSRGRSSGRQRPAVRKRAPRGANREAVLRVVNERPGVTPTELAAAAGVEKRTLYTLLSTLTKQGRLERQSLPGGQTGYRAAPDREQPPGAADVAH
jgi:predicted HTH transcriptional regulator